MRKVTLPPLMAVHNVGAMRLYPVLLVFATLAGACGGGSGSTPSPSTSPPATVEPQASASPSASPQPSEGAYGVLVTPATAATYTVSLVGFDGKVAGSAQASSPTAISCVGGGVAAMPAPVSTSTSRAYFMDARGAVRSLSTDGAVSAGPIINLPIGASRRSVFAVSPDDARMAVAVIDFTAGGASTNLFIDQLQPGGTQVKTFTETGTSTLWPIGWHGTNLVVAKVPVCASGSGPFCCGPQELHVIDAATAARKFTLGGASCIIAGPPSAAGAICETDAQANVLDWSAAATRSFSIQGQSPAYLSPNGNQAAIDTANPSNFLDTIVEGSRTTFSDLQTCGWIDSTRVLGTDRQGLPRVGDWVTGATVSVSAMGTCAGRIPGDL
jgi:hypothetical protein